MIKIKLFGEGCFINYLESCSEAELFYQSRSKVLGLPIEEAFLDVNFYSSFETKINNVSDLIIDSFGGLINHNTSVIEIWNNRKKIIKIKCSELINRTTLFPIYTINKLDFNQDLLDKGYYYIENVTGCIGIYHLEVLDFNIDCLRFETLITNFINQQILIGLSYNKIPLIKEKDDYLIRNQYIKIVP